MAKAATEPEAGAKPSQTMDSSSETEEVAGGSSARDVLRMPVYRTIWLALRRLGQGLSDGSEPVLGTPPASLSFLSEPSV